MSRVFLYFIYGNHLHPEEFRTLSQSNNRYIQTIDRLRARRRVGNHKRSEVSYRILPGRPYRMRSGVLWANELWRLSRQFYKVSCQKTCLGNAFGYLANSSPGNVSMEYTISTSYCLPTHKSCTFQSIRNITKSLCQRFCTE